MAVTGNIQATDSMNRNTNSVNSAMQQMANLGNDYMSQYNRLINMVNESQTIANQYNSREAQLQRDWSEAMSSTAHQREVKDLQAAGLNPVISAFGAGASAGSGAAASTSNQLTSALAGVAGQALNAVSNMAQSLASNNVAFANNFTNAVVQTNAQNVQTYGINKQAEVDMYVAGLTRLTNLQTNEATNLMNKEIARLNNLSNQQIAVISGEYGLSKQQLQNIISEYSANIAYQAAKYQADRSYDQAAMVQAEQRLTQQYTTLEGKTADLLGTLISTIGGGLLRRKK